MPFRRLLLRLERFRRNPKLAILKRPSVHAFLLDPAASVRAAGLPIATPLAESLELLASRRRRALIERHGSPTISVIMAARNAQDTIAAAIRSILEQSYGEIELIVVDDASTDDTVAVVASLASQDARVRVEHNPGARGAARARNVGLSLATGELVTFQDADDFSHRTRLEQQLAKLLANPDAVVCRCNSERVDERGEAICINGRRKRLAVIAMMFRREPVVSQLGYFDGELPVSEDTEYYERIRAVFGDRADVNVLATLYDARFRPGSLLFSDGTTDVGPDGEIHHHRSAASEGALRRFRAAHERIRAGASDPYVAFNIGTP